MCGLVGCLGWVVWWLGVLVVGWLGVFLVRWMCGCVVVWFWCAG